MMMKRLALLLVFGPFAVLAASPADAQRRSERREVFEAMKSGKLLSVPDIEHRVLPSMRDAQYLGFDFDSGTGIYTLKFLRNGNVIWVEVDGHSGQIVGRSGR